MNIFALILFAWILYLAINGKMAEFFSLATANPVAPPTVTARSGLIQGQK